MLPPVEIVVDGLPGREIMREKPPSHPGAQEIEDGIDQLVSGCLSWTATRARLRD
jgi:hypothetical protein